MFYRLLFSLYCLYFPLLNATWKVFMHDVISRLQCKCYIICLYDTLATCGAHVMNVNTRLLVQYTHQKL